MKEVLKIVLLSSAFNGLTQRAWLEVKSLGHQVTFQLFTNEEDVIHGIDAHQPDIVICPFLKDRVPEVLWRNENRPIIVIHPGIKGDRGASALDWTILNSLSRWGVTALQAVEEMDAGPIWVSHEFDVPKNIRKSTLYNGLVSDAAMKCIHDVIDRFIAQKPPEPLDYNNPEIKGVLQPNMKQVERHIDWRMTSAEIVQRVNTAEGVPGVLTTIKNEPFYIYDVHPDQTVGKVGDIIGKRDGAILVGTGNGSVWIGALKRGGKDAIFKFKIPATDLLRDDLHGVRDFSATLDEHCFKKDEYNEIHYTQEGAIGVLTFEHYNGAMNTQQCERMREALRFAKKQNTSILVIKGGQNAFSNGIHLNTIEAAEQPGEEAWRNIQAIDDVCLEILTAKQYTIAAVTGSSGAGGVMLALTADQVIARDGVVLNPHYATMGLYGSEYWTYTLPKRVGQSMAMTLVTQCLPISVEQALTMGLIDSIGPRNSEAFEEYALAMATEALTNNLMAQKKPFNAQEAEACRQYELAEMKKDLLDNRHNFEALRSCFVHKGRAQKTPERLVERWL